MSVTCLNPAALPDVQGYAQLAVATGTRLVFLSGQVARTADGTPVGAGDLAAQTEQIYRNLDAAVTAAGGSFADIAKLTVYVVDYHPGQMADIVGGAMRVAEDTGIDLIKPITLVGVSALGEPDLLIEIEATAVLA